MPWIPKLSLQIETEAVTLQTRAVIQKLFLLVDTTKYKSIFIPQIVYDSGNNQKPVAGWLLDRHIETFLYTLESDE